MQLDLSRFLNSHKNRLLEAFNKSNLPFSLLTTTEEQRTFIIEIKETNLQFIIKQDENDYNRLNFKYSLFRPDFPMTNWIPQGASTDITVVIGAFEDWLGDVVSKYLEFESIPDQWAEIRNVYTMA